jgi:hypothetical protein
MNVDKTSGRFATFWPNAACGFLARRAPIGELEGEFVPVLAPNNRVTTSDCTLCSTSAV